MSETTPKNVVFEKPKAVWVAGAWLSTVAAVLGAGMMGSTIPYGAAFTTLVAAWTAYGAGSPLRRGQLVTLGFLAIWTIGLEFWLRLFAEAVPYHWFNTRMFDLSVRASSLILGAVLASGICVVSGLLAGGVTRSRPTMWRCAAASAVLWLMALNDHSALYASATLWHMLVFGVIVLWAVRARTRRLSGSHCAGCGYDLAGIEGPVCPECGRARVMAVAQALKA